MIRFYEFSLKKPGLEGVRFLVRRETLPCNGDLESTFLDGVHGIQKHPINMKPGQILAQLAQRWERIVMIRNPEIVLDSGLPARIAAALASLKTVEPWALAGSGGLGQHDRRHLALYASEMPAIPERAGLQPLTDLMPDLYLINGAFLRDVPEDRLLPLDIALEPALALQGYLDGFVSVFAPDLTAGINGALMPRDMLRVSTELARAFGDLFPNQEVPTLSGNALLTSVEDRPTAQNVSQDLDERICAAVAARCDRPSISIITRTRFDRLHLLQRMLASISRARCDETTIEVILSTDVAETLAQGLVQTLQEENMNLTIKLQVNSAAGHSRVTNLLGGVQAASGEYVLFLDDDDYIDLFAFDTVRPAFFAGNRPLVALSSEVHEETWEETPSGRWVLTNAMPMNTYPASGWRAMFAGVNKLPICGLLIPRARLLTRLSTFELRHDLSEDYALFLLLLTDPQLPAIHECADATAHISIRGSENSVLMRDRRPWVQDITGFLTDLTANREICGAGAWEILRSTGQPAEGPPASSVEDLQQEVHRRNQEIRLLRMELHQLRNMQASLQETAA